MTGLCIVALVIGGSTSCRDGDSVEARPQDCSTAPSTTGCVGAIQPGDLILFRSERRLTRMIYRLFLADSITHVGIVVRHPRGFPVLLEAPGFRYPVMLSDIDSRIRSYPGATWVRRLHHPLTLVQSRRLTQFALVQEGKPFVRLGMLLPTLGTPTRKWSLRCASPRVLDSKRWFCSSLTVTAAVAAELLNPCEVRPCFTDPEDLFSDRYLDLRDLWRKPMPIQPPGERLKGWWSRPACGERDGGNKALASRKSLPTVAGLRSWHVSCNLSETTSCRSYHYAGIRDDGGAETGARL